MKFFLMETLVVSHVTLVMSLLVVTLEPVRVMGAGVVMKQRATKVYNNVHMHRPLVLEMNTATVNCIIYANHAPLIYY